MTRKIVSQSKEKRNRMELYYAVLNAIRTELIDDDTARPTRIQFLVGTSYDKLTTYFTELEEKNLITTEPLIITEKGKKFLKEYDRIDELTKKLGIKFFQDD